MGGGKSRFPFRVPGSAGSAPDASRKYFRDAHTGVGFKKRLTWERTRWNIGRTGSSSPNETGSGPQPALTHLPASKRNRVEMDLKFLSVKTDAFAGIGGVPPARERLRPQRCAGGRVGGGSARAPRRCHIGQAHRHTAPAFPATPQGAHAGDGDGALQRLASSPVPRPREREREGDARGG